MPRKSYKPEKIVAKLRQVDVMTSQGKNMAEAIRSIGVSEMTYYLYGRLSLCKTWMNGFSDPWQTSIRRRPAVAGAPKWGIRTRAPLQLVGLEGLDNSQAPRASVRSVQSISPSSRNRSLASGDGAIRLAGPQHGPDNPRCFVGDGNRCPVEAASLPKVVDPLVLRVVLVWRGAHDSSCAVHQ